MPEESDVNQKRQTPSSFGPKQAVPRVAQTGDDIAVVVQVTVQGRDEDIGLRVLPVDAFDPLGRGDEAHQGHLLSATLLYEGDGRRGGSPRRQCLPPCRSEPGAPGACAVL